MRVKTVLFEVSVGLRAGVSISRLLFWRCPTPFVGKPGREQRRAGGYCWDHLTLPGETAYFSLSTAKAVRYFMSTGIDSGDHDAID
jgi:hypothetical protein